MQVALAAVDWRRFLLYVMLPHAYAAWGIVGINFVQHDGNFVGRALNWVTFNNGLHGIHHMRPGLHWSLLRDEHDSVLHPFIDPNLELHDFSGYLWKAYGWSGERLTYDGKPVVLPEEGPDEDWVRAAAEESAHEGEPALGF
jgi:hypothetical protein